MTLLDDPCPHCGHPGLLPKSGSHTYQYAGEFVRVEGIEFATCQACGAETITPDQHRRNCERITDANLEALASKWSVTRPVDPGLDPGPGTD